MRKKIMSMLYRRLHAAEAEAHCDGPCGIYDPASARIAAEAVLSMTQKLNALEPPASGDRAAVISYQNTLPGTSKSKRSRQRSRRESFASSGLITSSPTIWQRSRTFTTSFGRRLRC